MYMRFKYVLLDHHIVYIWNANYATHECGAIARLIER